MSTITITEGKTGTIGAADTLLYPGINSCLTLTAVFPDSKRLAGHTVLMHEPPQLTLQQICDFFWANKGNSTHFYIFGLIDIWDSNWKDLPQTKDLKINGKAVANVFDIGKKLGYADGVNANFSIADWNSQGGKETYDIYFGFDKNKAKAIWGVDTATKKEYHSAKYPTW